MESSREDVERLLKCLQRGLSPLSRAKSNHVSRSPRTPVAIAHRTTDENGFVTPNLNHFGLDRGTKEVTPGVFYGSPIGKLSKRPPQVLRLLHEIRRDLAAEGYSISRQTIWATFPKQDQAIQFVASHASRDIAVFTYQDHLSGQRRFLATTYKEFWCRYNSMPEDYRHHYEIITEGAPCHLYFDLEYNCEVNMELNGDVMVDILLEIVANALRDIYLVDYDPSWTIELDSTTTVKFSRHVIIHIPRVAFKDNLHVGSFVGEVCRRIDKLRDVDEKVNQLYVLKGESRGECHSNLFLDQAVYSRNRSFRLPFSSKAGKAARLLASGRFRCKGKSKYEVFMDSLICRVDQDCQRLLTFGTEMDGCGGSMGMEHYTMSNAESRLLKSGSYCASGSSPFPELDIFIESIACVQNIPGKVRSWYWFSEYGVVVYNITGNRYCENIGRQHKGNHVMYIVDFRTAGYYQKCHDPDCRGYKSPLRPIPWHTIPSSFPLSAALDSSFEDQSSGVFSRLSLSSAQKVEDHGSHKETYLEDHRKLLADEAAWWEEVVSSTENVEKSSSSQSTNSQCDGGAFFEWFPSDDDWWKLVEEETTKFEPHAC